MGGYAMGNELTGEWLIFASVAIPANLLWAAYAWRMARSAVHVRKVGGLHFVKVGRFGASFWLSKR
jgi:hypothetical protein